MRATEQDFSRKVTQWLALADDDLLLAKHASSLRTGCHVKRNWSGPYRLLDLRVTSIGSVVLQ